MPALRTFPAAGARAGIVLAHGAGAGQASAFMVGAARGLAARGVAAATFDFPYIAAGRRIPDPPAILERHWRTMIAEAAEAFPNLPVFIGGKSMGGRIASQVAARRDTAPPAGLVFLGYPLHPPGRPQQRRDAHLPSIREPMLFVQGTRDAFGTAGEIRELLPRLRHATLQEIEGADHSFKVPAGGATASAVFERVLDVVAAWIVDPDGVRESTSYSEKR